MSARTRTRCALKLGLDLDLGLEFLEFGGAAVASRVRRSVRLLLRVPRLVGLLAREMGAVGRRRRESRGIVGIIGPQRLRISIRAKLLLLAVLRPGAPVRRRLGVRHLARCRSSTVHGGGFRVAPAQDPPDETRNEGEADYAPDHPADNGADVSFAAAAVGRVWIEELGGGGVERSAVRYGIPVRPVGDSRAGRDGAWVFSNSRDIRCTVHGPLRPSRDESALAVTAGLDEIIRDGIAAALVRVGC